MWKLNPEDVLYLDNHLIAVNKHAGTNIQGDISGDFPMLEAVREYIREKFNKPGNVFCGLIHRLDRPVSGIAIFARTSKALSRMNQQFAEKHPEKRYWAIVEKAPKKKEGLLQHHLVRNEKQNKSYVFAEAKPNSKLARLNYKFLVSSDRYTLLEVMLETGRHHQIRAQLASIGCVIKGDLKYGAQRSNPDGSISLHARSLSFAHPVSGEKHTIVAPVPTDKLWNWFENEVNIKGK